MIPNRLAKLMYWKFQSLRGRTGVAERLNWLRETQYLSPQEIQELQFRKLHRMIEHAYETVPYYRTEMKRRGMSPATFTSTEDLRKLPLLTRKILAEKQNELLSSKADTETLQTNYSSGSTGVRACFKQDANFRVWMRAHQLRTYRWCNDWDIGEKFVLLWGSEIYWSLKSWVDGLDNLISNRREFNTFRLSKDVVSKFVKHLKRFDPVLVSSYTNAMHLIAKEAELQGVRFDNLRAIQLTSEPVPPAFRERLAKVFGCSIYDKYGSRETNIVSHESPNHEHMCIQSENVVVEVLDSQDRPCPPGMQGRIVLTTLNNDSMPLIRYETSDLAAFVDGYCSSGVGYPRMTSVAGRLQDLIVTPNGDHIDAYFFSYLFMRFTEIHWFQVVQPTLESLVIRIYAPHGIQQSTLEALSERISYHCGYPFATSYEVSNSMPESKTGKFRLCISELGDVAKQAMIGEAA